MSIESNLAALTAAIEALTAAVKGANVSAPVAPAKVETPNVVQMPAPTPVAVAPAPMVPVAAAPVVASPSSPAMPAPPAFVTPAPAAPTGVPFTDGKGLIDYVMNAYKSMGPTKGSQIQGVLGSLGYQNINDVKAEHYAALHQGIEALK